MEARNGGRRRWRPRVGNKKWKEWDGGSYDEEDEEDQQGLKPLLNSLKFLVGVLEDLNSTLIMGRLLRR